MGEGSSNRFGVFHMAVALACGGLTACSGLPAESGPGFVVPVERITNAVAAGANRPAIAESGPAADRGELRLVVVPRGQAVGGMVPVRHTSRTVIASDHAVHPKKPEARPGKVSAPVATAEDSSAEPVPVD